MHEALNSNPTTVTTTQKKKKKMKLIGPEFKPQYCLKEGGESNIK
jgi:hypothetical protein